MNPVPKDLLPDGAVELADSETFESAASELYAFEGDAKCSILLQVSGVGSVTLESKTRHETGGDFYSEDRPNLIVEDFEAADDPVVIQFSIPVSLAAKYIFTATGAVTLEKAVVNTFFGAAA